ncbi:cobalt/zinc/cadmium efflux RND transporter, membrane fusion protein, CzcB family [Vibrio sp. JCM 19053]|nr:cobalt/zinc/cadmium efflux RND transporter, membrane fusion protein, CzcB family [Vibrio sp. JCM 19053]
MYADDLNGSNDKPGTVKIDPAVENNLGVKTDTVKQEVLAPRIETVAMSPLMRVNFGRPMFEYRVGLKSFISMLLVKK